MLMKRFSVVSRSKLSQQLHDLLVFVIDGEFNRRVSSIGTSVNVCTGVDQYSRATFVSHKCGQVKGSDAVVSREVHIRARLYELHDNNRVVFLGGKGQRRGALNTLCVHISACFDEYL